MNNSKCSRSQSLLYLHKSTQLPLLSDQDRECSSKETSESGENRLGRASEPGALCCVSSQVAQLLCSENGKSRAKLPGFNTGCVAWLLSVIILKAPVSQFPHLHNGTTGLTSRHCREGHVNQHHLRHLASLCFTGTTIVSLCLQLVAASRGSSDLESESHLVWNRTWVKHLQGGWTRNRGKGVTCSRSWKSAVPSSETSRGNGGVYGGETSGFEIFPWGETGWMRERGKEREGEGETGGKSAALILIL